VRGNRTQRFNNSIKANGVEVRETHQNLFTPKLNQEIILSKRSVSVDLGTAPTI